MFYVVFCIAYYVVYYLIVSFSGLITSVGVLPQWAFHITIQHYVHVYFLLFSYAHAQIRIKQKKKKTFIRMKEDGPDSTVSDN